GDWLFEVGDSEGRAPARPRATGRSPLRFQSDGPACGLPAGSADFPDHCRLLTVDCPPFLCHGEERLCLAVGLAKAEATRPSSTSLPTPEASWIATPSCLGLAMTILGGASSCSPAGDREVAPPILVRRFDCRPSDGSADFS